MGTPADDPEGYRRGSPLTYAEQPRGKVLLIQGMLDENVQFRHGPFDAGADRRRQAVRDAGLSERSAHVRSEQPHADMQGRILEFFECNL